MTADLTKGSPLRQIFLFSIPYLIGNLFQQFYNIVDMVIVGRTISPEAYAAVGSTGSLVWFTSGAIQALSAGFAVVTAQRFGSHDEEGIKKSFAASIKLSAIISVVMSVLCVIFARPMLELLRTPEDIMESSYNYIIWIFAGLAFTALYNLLSNMIRSLGDSRTPLYFLIVACVVNIILDFVFIVAFGMETDGAGLATVIAQLVSGICCIVYIVKKLPQLHMERRHFKTDWAMNISLLKIGFPMAFLNMVLSIGSVIMQFVTNGLGTLYVSSQTTGSKIETFVTQPILSFGSSVAVFAAQNYGAKKYKRVIEGGKKTVLMCMIWCGAATAFMIPFGRFVVMLLAGDVNDQVITNAYCYLVVNTLLTPILSLLVVYKSILQAVGRNMWSMVSGFTEIVARAGVSFLALGLLNAAVLNDSNVFFVMCFSNPMAWLFGLLTIIADYVFMVIRFNKLAAKMKDEEGFAQTLEKDGVQ